MTLEQAIAYIQDDELVEVTPKAIRLRKRYLDPHERKRASAERSAIPSRNGERTVESAALPPRKRYWPSARAAAQSVRRSRSARGSPSVVADRASPAP